MKTSSLVAFLFLAFVSAAQANVFNMPSGQTSLQTVPVGNPGNAPDTAVMTTDGTTGYGSVGYNYSIGKYDVTVGQYTAFLNAVAATDIYDLYYARMATDLNIAGISRSGSFGSYTYSVIGSPNHPITYVSWGNAARFANWLYNGQPNGGETLSTTEDGSYYLNGATTDTALSAVTRKCTATWVIPTENEWYKAAYYNPVNNSYFQYPTSSDTVPTSAPPGSTPNAGNFFDDNFNFAVTGSPSLNSNQNYLTDVGAYTASASPYGTFDQSGDVWQWNDTLIGGSLRVFRGGSWEFYSNYLASSYRDGRNPDAVFEDLGFRVALVPEPSTLVLAVLAVLIVSLFRRVN
jgi:formylglycine-generating enzyme